jgi:hypothetical protein
MLRSGYADGGSVWPCDPGLQSSCPECHLLGLGGALKAGWSLVTGFAEKAPSLVEALLAATPVGSALKGDAQHVIGSFFRAEALQAGPSIHGSGW